MNLKQKTAKDWFLKLRNQLVEVLERIEGEKFVYKDWNHSGSGGGIMGSIKGNIIEKGGVNISSVSGEFSDKMRSRIPGTEDSAKYWATGISVVIHPFSPLIPSMHFNSRYLTTSKAWFGGGMDITPATPFEEETEKYHKNLKSICDVHDTTYYEKHKKWCDDYFYLKHRNEARGVGGVFFDYLDTGDYNSDFAYTNSIGKFFLDYVEYIFKKYSKKKWTDHDKKLQMVKRGRYVEFNLLYDRGTKFGLETGGNTEAILMSMPPLASWD